MRKQTKKALRRLKNYMKAHNGKTKRGRVIREAYE